MPKPNNPVDRFFYHFFRSAFFQAFAIVVILCAVALALFTRPLLGYLETIGLQEQAQVVANIAYGTPTKTMVPAIPWHWIEMEEHDMMLEAPENWTTDMVIYASAQDGYPPCTEYFLISPDGTGVITIRTICGGFGGETFWNECGDGSFMISVSKSAMREKREEDYRYVTGEQVGSQYNCGAYGWLGLSWVMDVFYESSGEYDFYTVDRIVLSMQE